MQQFLPLLQAARPQLLLRGAAPSGAPARSPPAPGGAGEVPPNPHPPPGSSLSPVWGLEGPQRCPQLPAVALRPAARRCGSVQGARPGPHRHPRLPPAPHRAPPASSGASPSPVASPFASPHLLVAAAAGLGGRHGAGRAGSGGGGSGAGPGRLPTGAAEAEAAAAGALRGCGSAPAPPTRPARPCPLRPRLRGPGRGGERLGKGLGCWGGARGSRGSGMCLLAALEMLRENTRNRPKMSPEGALGSLSLP